MARLIVNPTSASRRELQLERPALSIGRDPANDLVLPDAMVSRRHAVIEQRGAQFFLRDCNSSNGSLVNGDRVSECGLKDGDLVAIGTTRLLFREEVDAEPGAKVVPHPHAARLACPSCKAEQRVGDQFCRQCGQQLTPQVSPKMLCPACGTVVSLPAKFCSVCGTVLPRASQDLETTKPQPRLQDEAAPGAAAEPAGPAAPRPAPRPAPAAVAPPARPALPSALAHPQRAGQPRRPTEPDEPRPANPLLRLLAALIDSALVGVGESVLLAFVAAYWWNRTEAGYVPILLSVLLVCLALLLGALYFVFFWGVQGATPGMKALGLLLVDREGRTPIGVGAAILRLLGYVVSALPLGLGFLLVPLTGRGLHDRIAGTLVVEREKD